MSLFELKPLGSNVASVTVGHVGPMAARYTGRGIPFLRSQNIRPNSISFQDVKFIDEKFHSELRKSALRADDVAVVRTGYPGTAAVVEESMLPMNCADLVIIRPGERTNPHYLASLLNSRFGKALISGNTVGAAQQHFNVTTAKNLLLPLPPIKDQRKIAAILTAYDDLIENNRQRIALLESMAEEIYREWFVRLRFPGHEHTPVQKGVPEGWTEELLDDAFKFTGGGTPSKKEQRFWNDGEVNWYTPSDITGSQGLFLSDSADKCSEEGLRNSSARIFPAYSIMLTSRATIGAIGVNTTQACTNQGFITCIPNERYPLAFLYHWLKLAKPHFEMLSSGATFAELTKGTFKNIPITRPRDDLIQKYESIASQQLELIESLQKQTQVLTKTRDLLLNRLISGKLRVDDLDIQFPPGMQQAEAA